MTMLNWKFYTIRKRNSFPYIRWRFSPKYLLLSLLPLMLQNWKLKSNSISKHLLHPARLSNANCSIALEIQLCCVHTQVFTSKFFFNDLPIVSVATAVVFVFRIECGILFISMAQMIIKFSNWMGMTEILNVFRFENVSSLRDIIRFIANVQAAFKSIWVHFVGFFFSSSII